MSISIIKSIGVLAIVAAPFAQGADLKFGLQGTLSVPLEDLKTATDSGLGLGAGVFMDIRFLSNHVIRPRIDYIQYPSKSYGDESRKWSSRNIGFDYLYFTQPQFTGPYLAAGLSSRAYEVKIDSNGRSDSGTNTNIGLNLGAGYVFSRHLEANVRYTMTSMDGGIHMASLDLGAAYTF